MQQLKNADIRCTLDDRNEKIGRKIRDAETKKIPYMLVVGEKEMANNQVALRKHGEGDKGVIDVDAFINIIKESCAVFN